MITAVIVDDEQKNVSMLITMLREFCPQVALLGTANSAEEGRKLVLSLQPKLIFLDVEMPYGSGFDMLRSLPDLAAEVIFITAFDQYALNAFRFAALDYLLKPVNIEELQNAVSRAGEKIKGRDSILNYELLLRNIAEKDTSKQTIALTDKGQQYFVPLSDIMYILADGSYTHIHTVKRRFTTTKNLKDFENLLPLAVFCRIHHGHLINKEHVARIQKGRGGNVLMKDGRELEVAVRRKEDFVKMFYK